MVDQDLQPALERMLDALTQQHWRHGLDHQRWATKRSAMLHVWNAFGRPSRPSGGATADDRAIWSAYLEARRLVGLALAGRMDASDAWAEVRQLLSA